MIRKAPLVPTIIVLLAAGIMVRLGFWQLDRAEEKGALIARYEAAIATGSEIRFPLDGDAIDQALFHRSNIDCAGVSHIEARAGTSAAGAKGWAHHASCRIADSDAAADVVIGWSRAPQSPEWSGGEVRGMIAPGPRLVADPPLAGLEANAMPNPGDLPNNHLAYAVQWFLFALTALVIYGLALRKRLAGAGAQG